MRLRIGVALAIVIIAAAALLTGPLSRGDRLSDILTGRTSLLPGGNRAPGGSADLAGVAGLGTDQRTATLHVACDPGGTGLSAALIVPHFADLAPRFDFVGLEGAASETPLTGILVSSAGSVRSVRMPVHGAATGADSGFTLTVAGGPPRRGPAARGCPRPHAAWDQAHLDAGEPALRRPGPDGDVHADGG